MIRLTHVGGPTALIELGGWRLLTDPTFDAPGRRYSFGWGAFSRKLVGPAVAADALGRVDAVLLSHDHHDDNLDPAGRALLPSARTVITTRSGSARVGGTGLAPWDTTTLTEPGRAPLEVTATPCRHGPRGLGFVYGDVIGFALRWDGGSLWITGDTVLYDGVRSAAERVRPDVVLLHLGAVRFAVTGPLHYTLTAADAVTLCDAARPRLVVPVHYEGWKHFSQGRADVERAFAGTPHDVLWLPIGEPVELPLHQL
jgi:L-ascorbate metabolism protein UlaG (beta-lactamase superfamily)